VRHQDHDAARLVEDGARVRDGAVRAAFGRGPAPTAPEIDRRNLRNRLDLEVRPEQRVGRSNSEMIFSSIIPCGDINCI
jgi:hypothetical protein